MLRRVGIAVVALSVVACARSGPPEPPRPAPLDPVGIFDFSTQVEGTPLTGTLEIRRTSAGFGGTIGTDMTEPIPVRSVAVEGQQMTVVGDTPDGPVTIVVTFEGASFTGQWTLGAMAGELSGKRRTST